MTDTADRIAFRTCPLCEATCGLEIEIADGDVKRIRGDRDDVFSHGFICPKGSTLKHLHEDPDRLRAPLIRRGFDAAGAPIFEAVEWAEAYAEVDRLLQEVRTVHGNEAVGVYLGNPGAHVLGAATHTRHLVKGLGAGAVFSASTVDQMPRHVASGYLYGSGGSMPVPDIDRTDLFVCIGANPYASNGSIATAPDFPGRIEAVQARGGRVIVIDPRRTRTAAQADLHLPIKPGTDAVLLAAVVRRLLAGGHTGTGRVGGLVDGVDQLRAAVEPFTAEVAAAATGVAAAAIDALADEIAAAPQAAVYGRIGTCTVEFGTLTTWLLDVISILTGNLDEPGGMMFPEPAHDRVRAPKPGRPYRVGRRHSRVNQRPEVQGEFPVADLPDEILESGEGQLKMMLTVAGNPVLSCPDGARMDAAFAALDAMVSVDIYLNETTRHANVILPPPGALEKSHYDLNFTNLSIRNVANFSPAVFETDMPAEEDILATLALIALGFGPDADPGALHDQVLTGLLRAEIDTEESPVAGRDLDELMGMVDGDTGSERILDAMLRTGPRGDAFGATPGGLSLERLRAHPHGIDFGALEPRLPGLLRTPEHRIDLFAGPFADDLARLEARLSEWNDDTRLRLVGRRHLRSNNSWMHNLPVLVKGKPRCTLQVHPDDAAHLGLRDGDAAIIRSRVGEVTAPVDVTDSVMPGVVSLPHGWGHGKPGARMAVAGEHAGVNSNVLTDPSMIDPLSGNAVLNGIPVEVIPRRPGLIDDVAVPEPPTRLTDGAVVLERARHRHVDGIHAAILRSREELRAFMDWMTDEPRTLGQTAGFVEECEAQWAHGEAFNYVMTDPVLGEVIGVCGLMTRPGPKRLEIGYWVRTDRTGAGVATAAATLLTEAGLRLAGIDIVEIHHDAANVASGRIPDKLGYVEAVRREVEIDSPGECGIEVIWEISRDLWLTSPARP